MANWLKTNEHPVERAVRIALGVALIVMAAIGTIGVWGYVGVVLVATGLAGTCPLYTVLGISTCPVRQKS